MNKKGKIIAGVLAVVGVSAVGYILWKRNRGASQVPALQPAGTDPATGQMISVNRAGQLVNAAGQVVNTATSLFNQLNPTRQISQYEGRLIRVARNRVYLVQNGLLRYVSSLPLPDGRGWSAVTDVPRIPEGGQIGTNLSGSAEVDAIPTGAQLSGIGQISFNLLK